ncbi:MAG: metal-sensitive transcriptional regulator [Anaerolineae bacterium]|nr:metal-sensitive transcriptional regulator [Anaerolineae bacterium]MCX8067818.1 metal-sensitive transcriptional regulator [Anaerolineae bacterium]MDW7992265.1 metal-sensitive transcriptional regulator [Anaerolineae bacterium]
MRGLRSSEPVAPLGRAMAIQNAQVKADLIQRLRRIEGQARGVARMIEEGRDCREVLQQLAAIRAAVQQASVQVLRSYTLECLQSEESPEAVAEALIRAIHQLT